MWQNCQLLMGWRPCRKADDLLFKSVRGTRIASHSRHHRLLAVRKAQGTAETSACAAFLY